MRWCTCKRYMYDPLKHILCVNKIGKLPGIRIKLEIKTHYNHSFIHSFIQSVQLCISQSKKPTINWKNTEAPPNSPPPPTKK